MTRHSRVTQSRWLPNKAAHQKKLRPSSVYVLKLSNHGSNVQVLNPVRSTDKIVTTSIGVNFFLYDDKNVPFIISDGITVFSDDGGYKLLFSKINSASVHAVTDYAKMKAGMYEIMSMLCEKSREKRFDRYSIISKGILYMESEDGENLSIPEIAALCNVSDGYFRRLFKEYSGLSPSDYRLRHKIKRAMLLLKYENMTVSEIAESLSFTTSAYFIKTFRRMTGTTPFKYRSSFL